MRSIRERLAKFFRRPSTRVRGTTGDARYTVRSRQPQQAPNPEDYTLETYRRVRWYPEVRDCMLLYRAPVERATFHFVCPSRPEIAALAGEILGPVMGEARRILMKGAQEFGHCELEKRYLPRFDVTVTCGQAKGEGDTERRYPYVWELSFAAFEPLDTHILVNTVDGSFAGIRQYSTRNGGEDNEIMARHLVHFAFDDELTNYGVPQTRATVPFVQLAEAVYDDMEQHSRLYGNPYVKGRFPAGFTVLDSATGEKVENRALLLSVLEGMESGERIALPAKFDEKGNALWEIEFMPVEGGHAEQFVPRLDHINKQIRLAMGVPELASSTSPDKGTYGLGQAQIDMFATNIEGILDKLQRCLQKQVVRPWVEANFGVSAPECTLVFEPVGPKVRDMLLQVLAQQIAAGGLEDPDGNALLVDMGKVAEDHGIPISVVDQQEMLARMEERMQFGNVDYPQAGGAEDSGNPPASKPKPGLFSESIGGFLDRYGVFGQRFIKEQVQAELSELVSAASTATRDTEENGS